MALLEVKNLHVEVDGKKILNGLDLTVEKGSVHAIMGPNGSGKSTLAHVLAGKDAYEVTEGQVLFNGENILDMDARRARHQGPVSRLPVSARNPRRRHHDLSAHRAQCAAQEAGRARASGSRVHEARARGSPASSKSTSEMLRRAVNVGFSGGEKKRNEILQMALLEPKLCVLDETDSGLDIDALKIVADGVNRLRSPERAFVVITHYQRLLDYIVPDIVHVLSKGRIVTHRRQGACARARSQGLRAIPGRGGVRFSHERRGPPDQDCGRDGAGGQALPRRRARCRATARRRGLARAGVPAASTPQVCRTGGSRSGNTPICAR